MIPAKTGMRAGNGNCGRERSQYRVCQASNYCAQLQSQHKMPALVIPPKGQRGWCLYTLTTIISLYITAARGIVMVHIMVYVMVMVMV
jgi:hypothetical protein